MEFVTCICNWLGVEWEVLGMGGRQDGVCALPILEEQGEGGIFICVLVVVV